MRKASLPFVIAAIDYVIVKFRKRLPCKRVDVYDRASLSKTARMTSFWSRDDAICKHLSTRKRAFDCIYYVGLNFIFLDFLLVILKLLSIVLCHAVQLGGFSRLTVWSFCLINLI